MTTTAKKIKLSPSQRRVLQNVSEGRSWDSHITGRSAYGGATATLNSLTKHGLLKNCQITDLGRVVLGALTPANGRA
ncbi:hypothetical protein [Duganella vulcania]|uniref:Transcriptional regulator n=1 Tax=Duganella vulcania TaxID=2692166 RepID=A0A845GHF0_9BURK|nr:hypothetical protein [Duganella vulcania]MYM92448.1 hypothetical protein [Duganella vulcania]